MKYPLALLLVTAASAPAATLTIVMSNNNNAFNLTNPFLDSTGSDLANGDLVQLGYFELAGAGAPVNDGDSFNGFVAIESVSFAVGADGKFTDQVTLDDAVDLPGTNSQTLQFGLRIFDAPTTAAANFFNTVTDDEWQFSFSPGLIKGRASLQSPDCVTYPIGSSHCTIRLSAMPSSSLSAASP